jgi:hypothetical protein
MRTRRELRGGRRNRRLDTLIDRAETRADGDERPQRRACISTNLSQHLLPSSVILNSPTPHRSATRERGPC